MNARWINTVSFGGVILSKLVWGMLLIVVINSNRQQFTTPKSKCGMKWFTCLLWAFQSASNFFKLVKVDRHKLTNHCAFKPAHRLPILTNDTIDFILLGCKKRRNIGAAERTWSTCCVEKSSNVQHQFMLFGFNSIIKQPPVFRLIWSNLLHVFSLLQFLIMRFVKLFKNNLFQS